MHNKHTQSDFFAFYTKWSDLLVISFSMMAINFGITCFAQRCGFSALMMGLWYHKIDADLTWPGVTLCCFVKVDNWHHGASPHGVQWGLVLGAQHTNLSVSAQWHCDFCSCGCCVNSNYQAVVFDIAMACALADKQPRPHGKAPSGMEFHRNAKEMPWEVAPKYSRDYVKTSQLICFR